MVEFLVWILILAGITKRTPVEMFVHIAGGFTSGVLALDKFLLKVQDVFIVGSLDYP